jgi:hypothetical protein
MGVAVPAGAAGADRRVPADPDRRVRLLDGLDVRTGASSCQNSPAKVTSSWVQWSFISSMDSSKRAPGRDVGTPR